MFVHSGYAAIADDEPLNGEITGRITDAATSKALSDVNVLIVGVEFGDASSSEGTYLIRQVPPGKYTLKVSCIGYHEQYIEEVEVKPGRLTVKNVKLVSKFIELDEVILSAARREQTVNMTPASVSVVKSADIQNRNTSTFDQALETVPGISMQRSIGVSVQALSLRGSSDVAGGGVGNRVLLAIDGRPALSSDSGGALWSLVPTNFIDRIEIVKGAFSSLYGSTAMGGVINVITKKPANRSYFKIQANSGFHELPPKSIRYQDRPGFFNAVEFNHSNRLGKAAYLLSLSRKESDGHRQHSAYEFYNLYGKFFYDLSNSRNLEVTVGADIGRNDYPHTWFSNLEPLRVAPKNTDNIQRKNTFSTDVYYYAIPSPRVKYSSRFYFYRQYFKTKFNTDDPGQAIPGNEPFGLFIRSDSRKFGNISQMDYYLSDKNYLIAGLDVQRDLVDSIPDTILYGKRQVNNLAIYAQDEHQFSKKFTINFGFRYDFNKLEAGKSSTQLSPKIGFVFTPYEIWSLRFLAGRAFRAPSIAERFFQREIAGGTRFKPNPDLRAERVTSLELGNRLRLSNQADFDVAFFHNTYNDLIYWIDITSEQGSTGFLYQVRNLNKARMQGVEVSLNVYPWQFLFAKLNYTYLDAQDLSENRLQGSLAYKIRHTFSFVTSLHSGPWLLNFDGRYNSHVEEVFLYPNDKPGAFFVINGKLQRRFGANFTGSVGVNNIFNIQYEELARYRMPGRSWIFGMSYEL
jgi:outer membrane receptor for ferrienterochelin and colicin